jgi:hypothetical protein
MAQQENNGWINEGADIGKGLIDAAEEVSAQLSAQATAMKGSAANLVSSAGTGFTLEPEAAAILIKACRDSIQELDSAATDLTMVSAPPALGNLAGSRQISQFTQQVTVDPQGIVDAVGKLRSTLEQMESAYQKASTNYQETERLITQALTSEGQNMPQANDGTDFTQ